MGNLGMESEIRVLRRFLRAQEEEAVDMLADQIADEFLLELSGLDIFSAHNISQALAERGLSAEDLNSVAEGKTGGPMIKALGGLVRRGLWYMLVRPFLVLGKLVRSPGFRQDIKTSFRKALRKDVRATKHMAGVASRWARGDKVHPEEFKAAKRQLLRILVKVMLIYFATPEVAGLFSGGLWHAIGTLWFSAEEVLVLLLDRPLAAIMNKLLTTPTSADATG
jgi:hypothetical protein